jgi:NAD(P)-dependent dehydrogenase (short-subunit alcohol dehydrogenase family)
VSILDGKVAVITGGAAGIGLATCKLFAKEGAKVLMVDLNESALKKEVATIGNANVSYLAADVSKEDQTRNYVQVAVDRYGGIDIYVANAGILGPTAPITEYPTEMFDRVFAVNVRGVWLGLKYVIPHIQKRGGGSIILTSSTAGIKGFPGVSVYSATKHALKGIMRSVANECGSMGIRVNTVHPGPIKTHMMDEVEEGLAPGHPEQVREAFKTATLLGRYGSPEEVARLMLYLACEESSYSTGAVFMVDGGLVAK